MCGSVPRTIATVLPLRSTTLAIFESLLTTSAVHSLRE
jgi:hypothetical protein